MFTIARTAKGRPTLMHKLAGQAFDKTVCGVDMRAWSRSYHDRVIDVMYCKRCKTIGGN